MNRYVKSLIRTFQFSLVLFTALLCQNRAGFAQANMSFDQAWWSPLPENEKWDFIYGFTDCDFAPHKGAALNMDQYETFVSHHVGTSPDSVTRLIRLAKREVKALPPIGAGEVWTEKHGFLDGDLFGDNLGEQRAFVLGYMACVKQPVNYRNAERNLQAVHRYYANPRHHLRKIAYVLQPMIDAQNAAAKP